MAILQTGARVIPGIDAAIETTEREITWGSWDVNKTYVMGCQIDPSTVDGGSSPTSHLRPGMALGFDTTNMWATAWDPADVDASELFGFLIYAESLAGSKAKWFGYALVGGQVRTKDIFMGATLVSTSANWDYGNLRTSDATATLVPGVSARFLLDDFTTDLA